MYSTIYSLNIVCIYAHTDAKIYRNIKKYLHLLSCRGLYHTCLAYGLKKDEKPPHNLTKKCMSADIIILLTSPLLVEILQSWPFFIRQLTTYIPEEHILLITTEGTNLTGIQLEHIYQPELRHIPLMNSQHHHQKIHYFAINMLLRQTLTHRQREKYPSLEFKRSITENPSLPYARNEEIIHREYLIQQIFTYLGTSKTNSAARSLLLIGKEGAGKTQLALEYAYRTQHIYQSILWIEARTHAHMCHSYNRICQSLQLPDIQAFKNWLSQHKNWLLIVEDISDAGAFMAEFGPSIHQGTMLLTRQTGSVYLPFKTLLVPDLSHKESAELLQTYIERYHTTSPGKHIQRNKRNRHDILDLTEYLGNQAATLTALGTYLCTTETTITRFYQHYRKQIHKQLASNTIPHQLYEQDPFITISLLNVEQLSPPAKDLLYACAILPAIPIPTDLFSSQSPRLDPTFAFLSRDSLALDETLTILQTYQFLQRTRDHNIYLSSRIQNYLVQQLNPEQQKHYAEQIIYLVYAFLCNTSKKEYKSIYQPTIYLIQICETLTRAFNFTFFEAFAVINRGGEELQDRGNYKHAERLYRTAFAILAHIYGPDDLIMVHPLQVLAQLAHRQHHPEKAEAYLQRALTILKTGHEGSFTAVEEVQKKLNGLKSPLN